MPLPPSRLFGASVPSGCMRGRGGIPCNMLCVCMEEEEERSETSHRADEKAPPPKWPHRARGTPTARGPQSHAAEERDAAAAKGPWISSQYVIFKDFRDCSCKSLRPSARGTQLATREGRARELVHGRASNVKPCIKTFHTARSDWPSGDTGVADAGLPGDRRRGRHPPGGPATAPHRQRHRHRSPHVFGRRHWQILATAAPPSRSDPLRPSGTSTRGHAARHVGYVAVGRRGPPLHTMHNHSHTPGSACATASHCRPTVLSISSVAFSLSPSVLDFNPCRREHRHRHRAASGAPGERASLPPRRPSRRQRPAPRSWCSCRTRRR